MLYYSLTKIEIEHGFLNNPLSKAALFLFLPAEWVTDQVPNTMVAT